jgi:hypothetical protein
VVTRGPIDRYSSGSSCRGSSSNDGSNSLVPLITSNDIEKKPKVSKRKKKKSLEGTLDS